MSIFSRKKDALFGVLIGAWLGGLYALITQMINWVFMPGVPYLPPSGDLDKYIGQYLLTGAVLGLISSIPENRSAGMVLGGICAAIGMALIAFSQVWGTPGVASTVLTMLVAFLPLAVLMMPVAYFVRVGVDAQHVPPDQPYLWARRILIPLVLSILVMFIGALSLHSVREREGFKYTHTMIQESLQISSVDALPEPLQPVKGFIEDASGPYGLIYSDRIDTFMGPVPVGAELSHFLIVVRFENGFSFACVFSTNRGVPNCANY